MKYQGQKKENKNLKEASQALLEQKKIICKKKIEMSLYRQIPII